MDLRRCLALSHNSKTLFRTAPASKNRGSAHRAARRLARTMQPRKTTKMDPKIVENHVKLDAKSIEVGRLRYVEAPKSIEVGRSRPVEAPKSIEAAPIGPGGSICQLV